MGQEHADRAYWLQEMLRIARPVMEGLSLGLLKQEMPVEGPEDRKAYTHLEAFGRLMAGLAPWLESGPRVGVEGAERAVYADMARKGIEMATDPESPDAMNFSDGLQPIVDAAFLAHAVVRAPQELGAKLAPAVKERLVRALKETRSRKPAFNNWLLFAAMIETALFVLGEKDWDRMRVDFAIKQHAQWYLGDGMYGDGPYFHMDYYNSYVIQPMLVDIVTQLGGQEQDWAAMEEKVLYRAQRYAEILERLISPEGTFPVAGRSIVYRMGAFQHLAQMALQRRLGPVLEPAQVRCALTAVIRRMMSMPKVFDEAGWLRIGFCGHQPELGEAYISTGSLYLCATVFLPLGLPADDPFWQGEAEWTAKKAWAGLPVSIDRAR